MIMGNKIPFRASYSILNSWNKGYAQDAIDMYFKLPREPNKYMEDGIKHHTMWQNHIIKHKELHPQLTIIPKKLKYPECEMKLTMPITDDIEFVGMIDCLDEPTLYEFKTGVKTANEYASTHQGILYGMLATYHGLSVDKIIYIHFNQYLKETDSAMVWLTSKAVDESKQWLIDTASEMNDYLKTNGYYDKYKVPEVDVVVG